jgi:hypothetical protein
MVFVPDAFYNMETFDRYKLFTTKIQNGADIVCYICMNKSERDEQTEILCGMEGQRGGNF